MPSKQKAKPFLEQILALVINFLGSKFGEKEIALSLKEKYEDRLPEWILQDNPLLKKGLPKIIKEYAQSNQKIQKYYFQRIDPASKVKDQSEKDQSVDKSVSKKRIKMSQESMNSEPQRPHMLRSNDKNLNDGKHHDNTSKWVVNKFEAPKKLQQIGVEEHLRGIEVTYHKKKELAIQTKHEAEIEQKLPEKQIKQQKRKDKNKKKVEESSSSEQGDSESEEKPKKVIKKATKKQAKQTKKKEKKILKKVQDSSEEEELEVKLKPKKQKKEVKIVREPENGNQVHIKKPFSRINVDEVGQIPENLKDNTFEAKFKYGKGGDEWGKFGYEKLKDTRGDSFKKTKGKLKNKAFQGANIDFNAVNSIKL